MEIKVLGTGCCAKCGQMYDVANEAIKNKGIECEVVKVTDMAEIMKFNVMTMPALVINNEVKFSGNVPSATEVEACL